MNMRFALPVAGLAAMFLAGCSNTGQDDMAADLPPPPSTMSAPMTTDGTMTDPASTASISGGTATTVTASGTQAGASTGTTASGTVPMAQPDQTVVTE